MMEQNCERTSSSFHISCSLALDYCFDSDLFEISYFLISVPLPIKLSEKSRIDAKGNENNKVLDITRDKNEEDVE